MRGRWYGSFVRLHDSFQYDKILPDAPYRSTTLQPDVPVVGPREDGDCFATRWILRHFGWVVTGSTEFHAKMHGSSGWMSRGATEAVGGDDSCPIEELPVSLPAIVVIVACENSKGIWSGGTCCYCNIVSCIMGS